MKRVISRVQTEEPIRETFGAQFTDKVKKFTDKVKKIHSFMRLKLYTCEPCSVQVFFLNNYVLPIGLKV